MRGRDHSRENVLIGQASPAEQQHNPVSVLGRQLLAEPAREAAVLDTKTASCLQLQEPETQSSSGLVQEASNPSSQIDNVGLKKVPAGCRRAMGGQCAADATFTSAHSEPRLGWPL